jgi:hypothetical protein
MSPTSPSHEPLRPRDLALVLLASGDLRPRQRARDQQPDMEGLRLKRQILEGVAARDPEPEDLEAVLAAIVHDLGPPFGPARAVAVAVRDEWRAACATPGLVAHLLDEAIRAGTSGEKGRGRGRLPR